MQLVVRISQIQLPFQRSIKARNIKLIQSCLICNFFLLVICCSVVKIVWFSDDNNNEINVHVFLKSIRVHSYFILSVSYYCSNKIKRE